MQRFLASATEAEHQASGHTVLYVPVEAALDKSCSLTTCTAPATENMMAGTASHIRALLSTDRELLHRLESAAIHWTRQIREVLARQNSGQINGSNGQVVMPAVELPHQERAASEIKAAVEQLPVMDGPIAEVAHWRTRHSDLAGIAAQLAGPRLQRIVRSLHVAGSAYAAPLLALEDAISAGAVEAETALHVLARAIPVFDELATISVCNLPLVMASLLARLRLVSGASELYSPDGVHIISLLRRVSAEVVRRCAASVDCAAMLDSDVRSARSSLVTCISTCDAWRRSFTSAVDSSKVAASSSGTVSPDQPIGSNRRAQSWARIDAAAVLAPSDAFAQRCRDLIDVCDSQLQFNARLGAQDVIARSTSTFVDDNKPCALVSLVGCTDIFGGSHGANVLRSLATIESTYITLLVPIRAIRHEMLNTRSSLWPDTYAAFQLGVVSCDAMIVAVIRETFDLLQGVFSARPGS